MKPKFSTTTTTAAAIFIVSIFMVTQVPGISQAKSAPDRVTCRVETDRSVLPAGDPQNVILKISLDAPTVPENTTRPRVNIALVMDRSGSMGGTKIQMAKAAAMEALSRLGKDDVFSLVTYDTEVTTRVPAQKVKETGSIIRAIKSIEAGGNTALFGGVSQGAAEIRKNVEGDYVNRVVLLSDGIANVGPSNPSDLGRLGAGLFKENISVTTVGVGTDYNEDLMAQLAQKSDGNTYFAESGRDLPRIFAAELGNVLNVVAKQVVVTITLPSGIEPVEIIGREGRIRGNRIELAMNQLYGGQEKFALVEVRMDGQKDGSSVKIAKADVSYQDPFSMKTLGAQAEATARFSLNKAKIEASTNAQVVKDYQLNLNALAQEKAIELSDQGKTKEAAQKLRQSAAALRGFAGKYNDEQAFEEAQESEIQADVLETQGMSKKSRKALRTKSYQMKNQQIQK
ncbi:VWA domain-containing protein [uncultured Desulfobacter sp.]|uniref:vWA domain-containing protein n=1 Tax=uncultured Desulfobacter sp. TaxID=240139 RepID=UPI0029F481CE|nr:VWA domain-containing protein [uncultured Desulfobacter sp.]